MTDLQRTPLHTPEPADWPSLAAPRPHPVRRTAALAALKYIARDLPATIVVDDNRYGRGGPGDPIMHVHRPDAFLDRLGVDAGSGFGESYIACDWERSHDTTRASLMWHVYLR